MKTKILLVEDEIIMNKIISYHLEKKGGYLVDCAYDGKEGLNKINENKYDVIILDYHMPYLNGYELLYEIKKRGIKSKILFLTFNSLMESKSNVFNMGADEYMVKPFDVDELLIRITKILNCNPK